MHSSNLCIIIILACGTVTLMHGYLKNEVNDEWMTINNVIRVKIIMVKTLPL